MTTTVPGWLASWPIDQFPLRRDFVPSEKWSQGGEPTNSCAWKARARTRLRSSPCMPASSSQVTASRWSAKRCFASSAWESMHKGIEKRFESMSIAESYRLAGRVSGDSTVAYAWAYAHAVEAIGGVTVPPRAAWLRALALERERIANHLGDLGYLGNDGGFAFGLAQFSRLKEDVLRQNLAAFGHRLMMDYVVPGRGSRAI